MTTIATRDIHLSGSALSDMGKSSASRVARAVAPVGRYVAYRNMVGDLNRRPDRILADMGIDRYDIRQFARMAVYGRAR